MNRNTYAFLFTDIEGSTRLWESKPGAMSPGLERHDALLGEAISQNGGRVFKTIGDAFCAVFSDVSKATAAAFEVQTRLAAEAWGELGTLGVRVAIHVGVAEERGGDYFGVELSRVSRLLGLGYGGQVLLSEAAALLAEGNLPAGCSLLDLGQHRLRDLQRVERVRQLVHPSLRHDFPPLAAPSATPTNLPSPVSSFVGREEEVAAVSEALQAARLVTLTGPGGVGKTRLAIEAATGSVALFPGGVWFIDLSTLVDPDLLAPSVAAVLGVREIPSEPVVSSIARHVSSAATLLVLDNCEHLRDSAALFVEALLHEAAGLRILATSRKPLGVPGERLLRVAPLSLPPSDSTVPLADMENYAALRLWKERAVAARANFAITGANASRVVEICRRLDGIPLAIELAASRLSSATLEQLLARLSTALPAIASGPSTRPERHRTLEAAVDWSYTSLDPVARLAFRQLAVFAGGWDAEGAVAVVVAEDGGDTFSTIEQLVDASLVMFEETDGGVRYRLLETLRTYGMEKLRESGELEAISRRHLAWCQSVASEAERNLRGPNQAEWLRRLDAEQSNFRAALGFAAALHPDGGLALASGLVRFWALRGRFGEGRRWLALLLAAGAGSTPERIARSRYGMGILAYAQGDYADAFAHFEAAESTFAEFADEASRADALTYLGNVAWRRADYEEALSRHGQSLDIYRHLGDEQRIAAALNNMGLVFEKRGDFAAARKLYEESLVLKRSLGDELGTVTSLHNLGVIASNVGDVAGARELQRESLEIARRLGAPGPVASVLIELGRIYTRLDDLPAAVGHYLEAVDGLCEMGDRVRLVECGEGLAVVATAAGRWTLASALFDLASTERTALGAPLPPSEAPLIERWRAEAALRTTTQPKHEMPRPSLTREWLAGAFEGVTISAVGAER